MVKLTAELIEQAAQYTNAVRDRELDLRGESGPPRAASWSPPRRVRRGPELGPRACVLAPEPGCAGSATAGVLPLWPTGHRLDSSGVPVDARACSHTRARVAACSLPTGLSHASLGLRTGKTYFILVVVILVLSAWLVSVDTLK